VTSLAVVRLQLVLDWTTIGIPVLRTQYNRAAKLTYNNNPASWRQSRSPRSHPWPIRCPRLQRFYLNGTRVVLDSIDPEVTLLEYLRGIGLTGTKLGCAEGGCGACTVVVSQYNPTTKKIYHASVNACLAPLVSVDGKHVITVEGIGNVKRPHSVQERIAKGNGSQCGVS